MAISLVRETPLDFSTLPIPPVPGPTSHRRNVPGGGNSTVWCFGVSLYKPRHRAEVPPCQTVQTGYEGTNYAYWCVDHQDGSDTPGTCLTAGGF